MENLEAMVMPREYWNGMIGEADSAEDLTGQASVLPRSYVQGRLGGGRWKKRVCLVETVTARRR